MLKQKNKSRINYNFIKIDNKNFNLIDLKEFLNFFESKIDISIIQKIYWLKLYNNGIIELCLLTNMNEMIVIDLDLKNINEKYYNELRYKFKVY